jgi:8-hydroxy-5-deazaflavin:NADPH oxidoreductase
VQIQGPIAVIGGTGALGQGLAYRFLLHGHDVAIGSRSAGRAQGAADELARLPGVAADVGGHTNEKAVAAAPQLVFVSVPYEGHEALVGALPIADHILVSCVNPLAFDRGGPRGVEIEDRSAAEEAARLHPTARVVGAFHHVAAGKLLRREALSDEHVLVCGDDEPAKQVVCEVAAAVTGHPGVDAGGLRLARYLEPFTAVLISVNRRYGIHAGLRLTGL